MSCIFNFFKSFFTDIICSQTLRRENFTTTLLLFFLSRWHALKSRGESSHPTFWKTISTLCSNSLLLTLLGIPTISMHSLLEYWEFSQHCLSISTKRLDNKEFTCFITAFFGFKLTKFIIQLTNFLEYQIIFSVSLFWSDSKIPISSFLFNLSKTSSVHDITK